MATSEITIFLFIVVCLRKTFGQGGQVLTVLTPIGLVPNRDQYRKHGAAQWGWGWCVQGSFVLRVLTSWDQSEDLERERVTDRRGLPLGSWYELDKTTEVMYKVMYAVVNRKAEVRTYTSTSL